MGQGPPHRAGRIPTLDGWRGIAILMVLLAHLQRAYLHHYLFGQRWLDLGQHGVTVFFVLSGYLITTGLVGGDRINLQSFYMRRFFRIVPPALAYLLFLVLVTRFTSMKVIGDDFWSCILCYRNYVAVTPLTTCTAHFWSLSVEEQFYFVWPALLALAGRRYGMLVAGLGAASIAVLRVVCWDYYLHDLRVLHTEVRADALFVGCLLALALQHAAVQDFLRRWGRFLFVPCALLLALDFYRFDGLLPLHESIVLALMIGATVTNPNMILSRFLENDFLKTTGLFSYSIYLWQGLFFRGSWGVFGFFLLPASVFLSVLFIERPMIALGRRLAKSCSAFSLRPVASPALCPTQE